MPQRTHLFCLLVALPLVPSLRAQTSRPHYTIATYAGPTDPGDGGQASNALLLFPQDAVAARDGTIYVADTASHRVRRIAPGGVISTVAGTGLEGFNGDSVRAVEAQLNNPAGLALDADGNLYIADSGNHRIRKLDRSGAISTVAGTGNAGYGGDGSSALYAQLNTPYGVAVDASGQLLIADQLNHRIRAVDPVSGTIRTVAGSGAAGAAGDNGPATRAQLNRPSHVTVDAKGNLYITDRYNHRIRQVTPDGNIKTLAGTGRAGYAAEGQSAVSQPLAFPRATSIDTAQTSLFIADASTMRIRKVDLASGLITTFAGTGRDGYFGDGGPRAQAQFDYPFSVSPMADGSLLVADSNNHRIRALRSDGTVSTICGKGRYADGGALSEALFNNPQQVAFDNSGGLLVADAGNYCVRRIAPGGQVTTVAGKCVVWGAPTDGTAATQNSLFDVSGVVSDAQGNLYIADSSNKRIRKVSAQGTLSTIATDTTFVHPTYLALDAAAVNLYVADTSGHRVYAVPLAGGATKVIAGTGNAGFGGDGGPAAQARLNGPSGLALDAQGNLYIADTGNHRIRKVDAMGNATTIAGDGTAFFGLEGSATGSPMPYPAALALDSGYLYIACRFFQVARLDLATAQVALLVGAGDMYTDFLGEDTLAASARIESMGGIAVDGKGAVYVADNESYRIRRLQPLAPASVTAVEGDGQTVAPGAASDFLVVQVTATNGTFLPDVTVNFAVTSGDAKISPARVLTDRSGYASAVVTMGKASGAVAIGASVDGVNKTAGFSLTLGDAGQTGSVRRGGF